MISSGLNFRISWRHTKDVTTPSVHDTIADGAKDFTDFMKFRDEAVCVQILIISDIDFLIYVERELFADITYEFLSS